jgi:peroxiredoxin family protein
LSDERLGLLLLSGDHARAHYAFVLASSAAAVGRKVVVFATNAGCRALLTDWSGLAEADRDRLIMTRGVAGLDELRDAALSLGVELLACEAGLRSEAIAPEALLPEVVVSGVTHFLSMTRGGQIVTL